MEWSESDGGEGERKREMECSHRQSLRDDFQSRISAEASSQESCLCRRRNLFQGLSQLRTSPNHQGLLYMGATSHLIALMILFFCQIFLYCSIGFATWVSFIFAYDCPGIDMTRWFWLIWARYVDESWFRFGG